LPPHTPFYQVRNPPTMLCQPRRGGGTPPELVPLRPTYPSAAGEHIPSSTATVRGRIHDRAKQGHPVPSFDRRPLQTARQ
jgi:hypothetical protein